MWFEPLLLFGTLASAALSAAAAWHVRRTLQMPARLLSRLVAVEQIAHELEATWRRERTAQNAWLEEAEGVLEAVERKRRRAAASASRADGVTDVTTTTSLSPEDQVIAIRRRMRGG